MANIKIDFACGEYDRTRALEDGTIQPAAIDLNFIRLPIPETFWRMCQHQEFDASELSLSAYLIFRSRPDPPFHAIPVFLSRAFRHSCVYINKNAGIQRPEDLAGRRIGVPEYAMTAIVWLRGIMQHEHGVDPAAVTWVTGGLERWGRRERVTLNLPASIRIEPAPEPETLNGMLDSGKIDALFTPRAPSAFHRPSSNVVRLFPDFKPVEIDYYKRTGCFPIMHVVAIKESILKEHPWAARNLYTAFCAAKDHCIQNLSGTGALGATLPWLLDEMEVSKRILGEDYWSYGVKSNRKTLETLIQYSYEQGLLERSLTVEEVFAQSTMDV